MRNTRIFSAICLIASAGLFMTACSKSDMNGSGILHPAEMVTIQSMAFQPATVTVVEGTMITWTNKDGVAHTVTSNNGTSFNSGNISSQGTFSFTPTVAGSYAYHCSNHPTETGIVQVVIK